jgi:hypothetical protein
VPGPGNQTVTYGTTSITYTPGTVYGNIKDTAGAYAWFMPTTAVRGIRLLYGALSGSPNYQLWLAQPAPTATITGQVALGGADASQPVPPGTNVELQSSDGTPVMAIDDAPVTVPVQPDGTYSIVTEQRDEYQLAVLPPAGFDPPPPIVVPALTANVTAPEIVVVPSSPGSSPSTPATTSGSPAVPSEALADSGSSVTGTAWSAGVVLAAGALLLVVGLVRRRPRSVSQSPDSRSSNSR